MQTYELAPGKSIDDVLNDLETLAEQDREITLVVPQNSQVLSHVEDLSRLRRFVMSQNIKLHAIVADRGPTLGLFRIMGFDVNEATGPLPTLNTTGNLAASAPPDPAPAAAEPDFAALATPPAAADEELTPLQLLGIGDDYDPAQDALPGDEPFYSATAEAPELTREEIAGPGPTPEIAALVDEPEPVANSRQTKRLEQPAEPLPGDDAPQPIDLQRPEASGSPEPEIYPPAPVVTPLQAQGWLPTYSSETGPLGMSSNKVKIKVKTSRGDTGNLVPPPAAGTGSVYIPPPPAVAQPAFREPVEAAPVVTPTPAPPTPAPPPLPAELPASDSKPLSGLDVTMPNWLRAEQEPPVPEPPDDTVTSALDVSMPAWMAEEQPVPEIPPAPAAPASVPAAPDLPSWLHEGAVTFTPASSGPPPVPQIPAWLREEEPPAEPATPEEAPTPEQGANLPEMDEEPLATTANLSAHETDATSRLPEALVDDPLTLNDPAPTSEPTAPIAVPNLTADEVQQAAIAQAGGSGDGEGRTLPPMDLTALGSIQQTPQIKPAKDGGLDGRTRALLLFGMALVRLAPAEAQAAAAAARRLGCGDEELKLVIQMAHAIGGGPSERLGRRIISQAN